jgi:hypothetical protein
VPFLFGDAAKGGVLTFVKQAFTFRFFGFACAK